MSVRGPVFVDECPPGFADPIAEDEHDERPCGGEDGEPPFAPTPRHDGRKYHENQSSRRSPEELFGSLLVGFDRRFGDDGFDFFLVFFTRLHGHPPSSKEDGQERNGEPQVRPGNQSLHQATRSPMATRGISTERAMGTWTILGWSGASSMSEFLRAEGRMRLPLRHRIS